MYGIILILRSVYFSCLCVSDQDSVEPIPTELVKALISQELLEGEPLETLFRCGTVPVLRTGRDGETETKETQQRTLIQPWFRKRARCF